MTPEGSIRTDQLVSLRLLGSQVTKFPNLKIPKLKNSYWAHKIYNLQPHLQNYQVKIFPSYELPKLQTSLLQSFQLQNPQWL